MRTIRADIDRNALAREREVLQAEIAREREARAQLEASASLLAQSMTYALTVSALSFVYFIQVGDCGAIKIGRSRSPQARMQTLQTANPETLRLRGVIPGGVELEQHMHERFAHLRISGEWFAPGGDLVACMQHVLFGRSP
jgi:hypothetical protein